ncbi:hypothetical protein [Mucilaginibacter ginsenosidivorans]|uniref:Carboxypeptidase-like regulatory domain-containing protein n=1 Tax=Mucilaginibacter ginsenosidivorans TaxID=398053 RepID=A0A5B8URH6_9SPHI|nr:hypothetical protein [Mucilaginibacter ginsenosidivorans]QEC61644.1 hypothetical protein FRZ54_03285 [Mucilaginibacter ginsenosidivorans]
MKYLIGILFLLVSVGAMAQQKEKPLVQFSGVVHNADSTKSIVPYVTITNKSFNNQTFVSSYNGYFSFVAHEQDTLVFTSIGFAATTVVIPANLPAKSYTTQVNIKPQIVNLPTFRVFPWATTDEFKKDFLNMKLADDDLEIARKNISHITIAASGNTLPRDGGEMQAGYAQQEHNNIVNSHSTVNPLLSPIAWGTLINQIAAGDKSRQNNGN